MLKPTEDTLNPDETRQLYRHVFPNRAAPPWNGDLFDVVWIDFVVQVSSRHDEFASAVPVTDKHLRRRIADGTSRSLLGMVVDRCIGSIHGGGRRKQARAQDGNNEV